MYLSCLFRRFAENLGTFPWGALLQQWRNQVKGDKIAANLSVWRQSKSLCNERFAWIRYLHKFKSIRPLSRVFIPITQECIELMKSPLKEEEPDKFCWTINLDRKVLQIEFFDYKKYSSFTFLDPNRNIFGFTLISKPKQ